MKNFRYVEKTSAECINEDSYLVILHLKSRIALQVARKIAPCNMAFTVAVFFPVVFSITFLKSNILLNSIFLQAVSHSLTDGWRDLFVCIVAWWLFSWFNKICQNGNAFEKVWKIYSIICQHVVNVVTNVAFMLYWYWTCAKCC